MSDTAPSRRAFLGTVARAGLAAAVAPMLVPRHVLGRGYRAPSDTLYVGCVGVGGMGRQDVTGVSGAGEGTAARIAALCDVDWKMAADAFGAFPQAARYRDFREMLEKERALDAVTVSTPDHTHATIAMAALGAGKHVYCQKPLARTLWEVRELEREAARRPRQATQMGNQGHAGEGTRQIREWVEAGLLGTVREVHYWTNRPIWPQGIERPTEMHQVPATLAWDLWLGPAPERAYHPAYAPFRWRGWWDFGTGALGDIACHAMDAAFWTLDLRFPTRIDAESTEIPLESAPKSSRITYHFPARGARQAVAVVWRDGGLLPPRPPEVPATAAWPPNQDGGQLWIGERGKLVADMYGRNPRLLDPKRDAEVKASPPPVKYPRVKSVYDEWIDAAKGGTQPGSSFAGHAGPLTEMVLLGNLAVRAGRTIEVDPETGAVRTQGVPDEWVRPAYRKGWGW
jgi:predicted dehydrogenase